LIATYRVQLTPSFTFRDLGNNLDYFVELGISHLYLSPVLEAVNGSNHGYDVVDHSIIRVELGGEREYLELLKRARSSGLGVIQDIVPNHMAVNGRNWRLMDVLRRGKESPYWDYFDLHGDKVKLPILEDSLENVLSRGLIEVKEGQLVYRDWRLPLSRISQDLKETLNSQNYVLTSWRESPSYRRFFEVNGLIALREENDWVFRESHGKLLDFPLDGLRVDHVDGLFDPAQYLDRLRTSFPGIVLLEKILSFGEVIPFKVDGTTGYDFMNYANLLFTFNEEEMDSLYQQLVGKVDVESGIMECKLLVMETLFRDDLSRVARALGVEFKDLEDYVSCLHYYRTYGQVDQGCDREGKISRAARENLVAYRRLEQYMPAVHAKGYEDTFLFRYDRLISLNEVGSDLRLYSLHPEEFHGFNQGRVGTLSLNGTSTHDTKFSEDVRMKISAVSERPQEWRDKVREWHELLRPRVDPNDEYRFFQVLVGSYFEGFTEDYRERLKSHMLKTIREAKVHTSWRDANGEYEEEVMRMVDSAFNDSTFRRSFLEFEGPVRKDGMVKSLSLLALKVLSPGVPDFYQGTETWRYLLTDPDNRRPVDFDQLRRLLKGSRSLTPDMVSDMNDGRIKMYLTTTLLRIRRENYGEVFRGDYEGLRVQQGLCGFRRGELTVIVRTMASKEFTVKLDGEYTDLVTGESVKEEVSIGQLPRVLRKVS
jgi:(1->4)-alpha-D-glucan 1-alpha-D-glucosylmutase